MCLSKDSKDKRLRCSVLIQINGKNIVVDSGPDFRQQMLTHNVTELDALLVSHEHKDHIAGMDDVRAYNYRSQKDFEVYTIERVANALKVEFHYAFAEEKYPGVPNINLNIIENKPFNIEGVSIIPVEGYHHQLSVLGFRFEDFVYLTDVKTMEEEERAKIRGCKVLVVNALRKREHISHFSLDQAIEFVDDINPEQAYFIHMSHYMGLHQEVSNELPDHIGLAYDGLVIDL